MRIITCNNKWNNGIHWIRKITYDKIAMYNRNVKLRIFPMESCKMIITNRCGCKKHNFMLPNSSEI